MSYEDKIKLLEMVIETQASRIADQEATIEELRIMVEELRSLKANLEETLEEFRRQFFGVRSEKTSASPKKEAEKKTVQVKGYTATRKKKATREELYANLPVREILCKVPEEERRCDWCNAEMVSLNAPKFVREELRITPAKVERIRYMQEVLICPECKKAEAQTVPLSKVLDRRMWDMACFTSALWWM